MAALGDVFVYVGPDGDQGRVLGATYRLDIIRGSHAWLRQLPVLAENVDWHGPVADLDDPAFWQTG